MPQFENITVPGTAALKRAPGTPGSAWVEIGEDRHATIRLHLGLKQAPEQHARPYCGEIAAEVAAPSGSEARSLIREEVSVEECMWKESITEIVNGYEASERITANLSAKFGLPAAQLTSALTTEIHENFTSSFRNTNTTHRGRTETRKLIAETEVKVNTGMVYIASSWRKTIMEVHLLMVDYLTVAYGPRGPIRRRRLKVPEGPTDILNQRRRDWYKNQPNVVPINEPLFRVEYWTNLPRSFAVRSPGEYVNEVPDPFGITMTSPTFAALQYMPDPEDVPTLYELANIFPNKKW